MRARAREPHRRSLRERPHARKTNGQRTAAKWPNPALSLLAAGFNWRSVHHSVRAGPPRGDKQDRPPAKASSSQQPAGEAPDWAIWRRCVGRWSCACTRALAKRAAVGFARSRARFFRPRSSKNDFVLKNTGNGQCGLLGLLGKSPRKSPLRGSAECAGRTLHWGGGLLGSWLSWSCTLLVLGTTALLI